METLEIGKALVALCSEGKFEDVIEQYYSDDIVSIEGASQGDMPVRMEGIEAVKGKNQWWIENHEMHDAKVQGPFVAENDDRFVVHFYMDVTPKAGGDRTQMTEVGIYTVKDGKIVEERFLYHMG